MSVKSTALLLLLATTPVWSLPAPRYLSVDQWKNCASTISKDQAQFVCLPEKKPQSCPELSWKKLKTEHLLPSC